MTAAATCNDQLALIQADRDHLARLLRGLAARLDELDRRLAGLAWRGRDRHTGVGFGELLCERTALESERERLADRLTLLAGQLNAFDTRLSNTDDSQRMTAARVGTCPYCGYPSLGSGLCAFCRPHLAR